MQLQLNQYQQLQKVISWDGKSSLYDGIMGETIYYVLAVLIHASARVWFPKSTIIHLNHLNNLIHQHTIQLSMQYQIVSLIITNLIEVKNNLRTHKNQCKNSAAEEISWVRIWSGI